MRVDTIILSFFNSFWSSATKISRVCRRTTLSVSWHSALDCTPTSQKKQADFGNFSRNMPYCQCTLPYGDCKAVMRVGCLPNCGELFANFWSRLVDMKVGGGRLPGGDLNIRAGSPCKGPPPIFGGLELRAPMGACSGLYGILLSYFETMHLLLGLTSHLSFLNNNPKKQQKPVTKSFLNENKHM